MNAKRTEPTVSLLQGMPYVNKDNSDIRVRFRAMAAERQAKEQQAANVQQLRKRK